MSELARSSELKASVEVEFKLTSLAKLRQSPPSMFYYDLVMGHRLLFGGEELLAGCEAHQDATQIPLAEATRLLMNRGAGLLFAKTKLQNASLTPEDADFIGRNQAKAQLALGDAVLAAGRHCRISPELLDAPPAALATHWRLAMADNGSAAP